MNTTPFSAEDADVRHLRTLSRDALEEESIARMDIFEAAFWRANPGATLTFENYKSDPPLLRALEEAWRRHAEEQDR